MMVMEYTSMRKEGIPHQHTTRSVFGICQWRKWLLVGPYLFLSDQTPEMKASDAE